MSADLTAEEKLTRLVQLVEAVVPYVAATINDGNTFASGRPGWIEVNEGRVISARRQLDALLGRAKEFK